MTDFRFVSDVASASNFANADDNGTADYTGASYADGGVRPIIITCTKGRVGCRCMWQIRGSRPVP